MGLYENLKSIKENAEIEKQNKEKESQYTNQLSDYDKKKKEHDVKVAEYEKMVNTDGYLSRPVSQGLIFTHEPNANVSISGQSANYKASKVDWYNKDSGFSDRLELKTDADKNTPVPNTIGNSYFVKANGGTTVTASYKNLQNSYYFGRKIASVKYTYTPKYDSNFVIGTDPTKTIFTFVGQKDKEIPTKMTVEFFYEDGTQVDFDKGEAIFSLSSLNRYKSNNNEKENAEFVEGFTKDEFIKITGSTIGYENGKIQALTYNSGGSGINDESNWDTDGNPKEYYGAAAVEVRNKSKISLTFGKIDNGQWFKFNADVKAPTIPPILEDPPTKPDLTPLKPIEKIPCKQPECYEGCHECCCDSIDLNDKMEDNLIKVDSKIDKMFNQICILKTANCFNRALLVSQYAYKLWCLMNDIMLLLAYLLIKKGSKPKTTTETSSNKQILKYSSETITDDDLEWDKTVVYQKGEDGYIVNTTTKTYQDGVLTNEETKETERKEPVKEIIRKGTKKTDTIILTITDNVQNIPYYSFKISGKVGDKFDLKNYVKDKLNSDGSITYNGSKYTNPFNLMEDTYRIDNISDTSEYFYRKRS